jgi:hypothetical protein
MLVSQASVVSLNVCLEEKGRNNASLCCPLPHQLSGRNFEIKVFGSKEEPRSSGQATALFLFEQSALFYLR